MQEKENTIEFSVIIPASKIGSYVFETCRKIREAEGNCEIIVLPDERCEKAGQLERDFGVKIISTERIGPGDKRDHAIRTASGRYLAMIDDDAYPRADWFRIAKGYLERPDVGAIGGPQLTPPDDSFWQKVSGAMFSSPLSGGAMIRYSQGKTAKEVEDWPTVNFFMKKEDFTAIGGFNTRYWPGEDTKICLEIIKKLKKKIVYVPDLVVYHHRRAGLPNHLRQTGSYGLHRGYFFRVFPETSRKLGYFYFMPSLWVMFLFFGSIFSFFSKEIFLLFKLGLAVYASAVILSALVQAIKTKEILVSVAHIPYLVMFHIWYGIRFIQGFVFTKELKSKLR